MRSGLMLCAVMLLAGCSQDDGQERYRVSGKVTIDGKAVPYGEILLTPDAAKGNSGAQGIATIKDGRYDTQGSRAPGVASGPVVVQVTALSDASGKLLCEHEFQMEVQKADTTHDIDIPASAAQVKRQPLETEQPPPDQPPTGTGQPEI